MWTNTKSKKHRRPNISGIIRSCPFRKCQDKPAFASVNSKRVDILVTDLFGFPCAVIEYQGGGHYQNNAIGRDAVKKEACRKAGIGYLEIEPGYDDDDINRLSKYVDM
ncbi:DUF2726 domain-containing protein [Salmonella enterica subsp. enterica serovar Colindale]|nr:DUF2726 domain-containing protein [Salmonella enterica subsp. enterica serovar Colindale]